MHYHLEIIMPPTEDIEGAVAQILKQFNEQPKETDEDTQYNLRYAFWDWYTIGGRWAGEKLLRSVDQKKLASFYKALEEMKVTVIGLVWGKEELSPASQIPAVDALWNEYFPDSPTKVCPIFKHYEGSNGDIMPLKDIPESLTAARVIVAGLDYENNLKAQFMVQDDIYNGCNFIESKWGGTVKQALELAAEAIKWRKQEWIDSHTPRPDWVVVTVDYRN